jgi:type II secretory pathway component PulM
MTDKLSTRLADISATLSQAEAVLGYVGQHSEDINAAAAAYGAQTIIGSAIEALGKIEVEQRETEPGFRKDD